MTKTIKNSKDVTESLGYSLDGIGSILVLLFFASLFINVFEESQIGTVIVASISKIIGGLNFTGAPLILMTVILVGIGNLFLPGSLSKWQILSGSLVTLFMNASISPEFSQVTFVAAESLTNGLTPLFLYFAVYIAFMEKYNTNETTTISGCTKYMVSYATYISIIWILILIGWYLIGLPIGIGSYPGVIYGA